MAGRASLFQRISIVSASRSRGDAPSSSAFVNLVKSLKSPYLSSSQGDSKHRSTRTAAASAAVAPQFSPCAIARARARHGRSWPLRFVSHERHPVARRSFDDKNCLCLPTYEQRPCPQDTFMVRARLPLGQEGQADPSKGSDSLRVLIADDDRDTVLTLATVLRDEGHEVRCVYSGSTVLEAVTEFDPHAVLLDIKMPGLDGYDVARGLRTKYGEKVLLIGISGIYKKDSDRVLAGLVGFDHYLVKPYLATEVLKLLETLRKPRIP
jgi:CheY-like chemotaxis protein